MGGLFSKPKMPEIQPPTRMPVQDDAASKEAKRRRQAELQGTRGRASTDLTGADNNLLGR